MENNSLYGKKSYEYALGVLAGTSHSPLSSEQLARLTDADLGETVRLIAEFYGVNGNNAEVAIATEFSAAKALVREICPDSELCGAMFFEEDAVNLKLFLKADILGRDIRHIVPADGYFDAELVRISVKADDYSLLGAFLEKALVGIKAERDLHKMSCVVDNAFFENSLDIARRKSRALYEILLAYANGRNKLTYLRFTELGIEPEDFAFLDIGVLPKEGSLNIEDIAKNVAADLAKALELGGIDDRMGAIAKYYFTKKNEAALLRRLLVLKSTEGGGVSDE